MKKIGTIAATCSVLFLACAPAAQAITIPTKTERMETRAENMDARCANLTNRVNLIISRYDNNKQRHIDNFTTARNRLQKANQLLKTKGYDTAKIEQDYQVLGTKITQFSQDATATVDQLRIASKYPCGESAGQYKTEMLKARDLALKARATALDTRSYYQATIRPDLQALRKQKPSTNQ